MTKCPNCGLDPRHCACSPDRTSVPKAFPHWVTTMREYLPFAAMGIGATFLTLSFWLMCALVGLWGAGCGGNSPTPVVEPPGPGQTSCSRYCGLLARDRCPGWDGSPGQDEVRGNQDDAPCETVCTDLLSKGTFIPDMACFDKAVTCGAAESCLFD